MLYPAIGRKASRHVNERMLEEGVLVSFCHFPMFLSKALGFSGHQLPSLLKGRVTLP